MEALRFDNFDPRKIPFQERVLYHFHNWDYSSSPIHMLLSGTIGSAKSSLASHIAVFHCLTWKGARIVVGRQKMPDVKRTIRKEIIDHIKNTLTESVHYTFNKSDNIIYFHNGSEIMFISWHDADWEKFRSLNISGYVLEEATENKEKHWPVVNALNMRLGRQPHVPVNFGILLTNPDGPEHPCYEHFIDKADTLREGKILIKGSRLTFFSKSEENPFLPKWYINQLRKDLPKKEAERMLDGKWVSIRSNVVYGHYDQSKQFKKEPYLVNLNHPVHFSFDFNIGAGKPMSMCFFQYIDDVFHVFHEVVIEGADTEELLLEASLRGHLDYRADYIYHGDASGKAKHSASKKSDYDIIAKFLENYRPSDGSKRKYEKQVPLSNPPVRERHNKVNSYCLNGLDEIRLYVWGCEVVDKALRLTKLKDGGSYIEDDSKEYQHVGTALGYGICSTLKNKNKLKLEGFSKTR